MLHLTVRRASARGLALMVAALLFGLTPLAAYAATINVDGTICTLPEAIEAANTDTAFGGCPAGNGDDILLLGGLTHSLNSAPFDPEGNGLTATPSITTTIVISGGVGGGAVVQRTGAAQYRLFYVGPTGNLTLQNVTVREGDSLGDGGAIYNRSGYLNVENSRLLANTAASNGGAIYSTSISTNTITNTLFSANHADLSGGAIYNYSTSRLTVSNSTLTANSAVIDGGGLMNFAASTAAITNTRVLSNTAGNGGGIINFAGSTIVISDSEIRANQAITEGGGLYSWGSVNATIDNTDFRFNQAMNGGGIHNFASAVITLTNANVTDNIATNQGGGIFNSSVGTVRFSGAAIADNQAALGGGIYSYASGTATLIDAQIRANTAITHGGGIFSSSGSTLHITNTQIISNSAGDLGGGIFSALGGRSALTATQIISNHAGAGGGFYAINSVNINVANSEIRANTAITDGGGILTHFGILSAVKDTLVTDNSAGRDGGGIYHENIITNYTRTLVLDNVAGRDGGGIYNSLGGNTTFHDSQINANHAISAGGGILNHYVFTATMSKVNSNSAVITGSALYQEDGHSILTQGCIVNNSDTAVVYKSGLDIEAVNNWWGAPDGPGPIGPGIGDSVSANVIYSPFLTTTVLGCSSRSVDLAMSKRVSPAGNLGAGQPVTYTINITNYGTRALNNIYVTEAMPAAINVNQVITAPGTGFNGSSYVISTLAASEAVTIVLVGKVSAQLNQNMSVTNTAVLTHPLSSNITKTTSSKIALSELLWGDYFYTDPANNFAQGETLVHIEVKMITPTMYATVTAQIVFTGTNPPFANAAAIAEVAASAPVTFPPGSTSQEVVLTIPNTGGRPRAVELTLQEAKGATVGPQGVLEILLTDKIYLPRLRR